MKKSLGLALLAFAVAAGCGSSKGSSTPPSIGDGLPDTCSPLRVSGACMMPWPNAIYLSQDASTKTGYRLALTADTLPVVAATSKPFDPTRYNQGDGFSAATPILAYFTEQIDPTSLPPLSDPTPSLQPSSATVLVDMTSNQLVAHFSEVDLTVRSSNDRQALMIRPLQRLLPGHRYAVGITKSIQIVGGGLPAAPPLFDAIASGNAPSDPLSQAEAARMPDILTSMATAGVTRDQLLVAWDFVTGSDEYVTGHVLSMRDQAMQTVGANGIGYTIQTTEDNVTIGSYTLQRRIRGTFTVPQFLSSVDVTASDTHLLVDSAGAPQAMGTYEAPFTLIIPPLATTQGPLPLVVFGHGLLDTGDGAMGSDAVLKLATTKGYVIFATDWIGLSAHENPLAPPASEICPPPVPASCQGVNGAIADALTDLNYLPRVTDRLQQSLVNAMVLARTVRGKLVADPAMTINGQAVADPTKLFYWGISLGGIMGGAFMGYEQDITLGNLTVAGGYWSLLLQRSAEWPQFHLLLTGSYPDFLDQQLLLALVQMDFDFSDPASVASHLLSNPLPNTPAKQIAFQMAVGDSLVPNVASEDMARTEQIPLIGPSVLQIFGMSEVNGPQSSGLTVINTHAQPVAPLTNEPRTDNGAHGAVPSLPVVQDQIDSFFRTGQVTDPCDGGPCDFPNGS